MTCPFAYLAQINSVVCDFAGNAQKILDAAKKAKQEGAALCITPAYSFTGWPLAGWVKRCEFWSALEVQLKKLADKLAQEASGVVVVFGAPTLLGSEIGCSLYVYKDGDCLARFDDEPVVFEIGGLRAGLVSLEKTQTEKLKTLGADFCICCQAWTYDRTASPVRRTALLKAGLPILHVNLAGAQDEHVYEGASAAVNGRGDEVVALRPFGEDAAFVAKDALFGDTTVKECRKAGELELLFEALVVAVRDYVRKNGFSDVVLGLSGGADSALVAAIAVEALGREHVHAVMMPTRFTTDASLRLAQACAENLGIDYRVRPIGGIFDSAVQLLADDFAGTEPGLAEENLQARARGMTLMALSNKFGWLTLATGNKSESAAGYCTLYGDTAGAYSPIKDVYKTDVWALMRLYNELKGREVIPEEIITRPPSAELREGQTDEAALMPYAVLDAILHGLLEEGLSPEEVVRTKTVKVEDVDRVVKLWLRSEYKRRQCPTGPCVSGAALSSDILMPMTNRPSWR